MGDPDEPSKDGSSAFFAPRLNNEAPKHCELCALARTTRWYGEWDEPFGFVILDCDSCDVPMAVLREHRSSVTSDKAEVLRRALSAVAQRQSREEEPR